MRQTYELTVAAEDKERLKMMSDVVNESTRLCDIDLTQFRVRTPTLTNVPSLVAMLAGAELADVPQIVLTIDPCIGCMER